MWTAEMQMKWICDHRSESATFDMFRRAGRDLGLIHQVEAGWGRVVAGKKKKWKSFFLSTFFDILFRKWYWSVQSLFVSFASMETVKSSLKAERKMGQGIFDVS